MTEDGRKCRRCSDPLTGENSNPKQFANRVYICRSCDRAQHTEARERNAEKHRETRRRWAQENKDLVLANKAAYRDRNRESLRQRGREYAAANKERLANVRKQWATALKAEVMSHYGGGCHPQCKACGYTDLRALTIDHVEGGGSEHRRELNGGGVRFYQWLRANSYPSGYQVLCMNCQFIKKAENNEHRPHSTYSARNQNAVAQEAVIPAAQD